VETIYPGLAFMFLGFLLAMMFFPDRRGALERRIGMLDRKLDLLLDQAQIRDRLATWQKLALSASSSKIQIIKACRQETGADLAAAKKTVEDWIA
jgi:hypothetical protein